MKLGFCLGALGLAGALGASLAFGHGNLIPRFAIIRDASGFFGTINEAGPIDTSTNPYFQKLGTNGRSCDTCHQPSTGWTITPENVQKRFEATQGTDPIFRTNDGTGCPTQDVSTVQARRESYSLLMHKGLIRVEINVPGNAEFTVLNNDNPYGCTSTSAISVYRRVLPSTNLPFLSTVMWDGRETLKDSSGNFKSINEDLADQALGATMGHAQAAHPPTDAQIQQIVNFETKLFTAQVRDDDAGELTADGGKGGPKNLSAQEFFLGINDPFGGNPTGATFTPAIFNLFDKWGKIRDQEYDENTAARRAVARGEELFNSLPITITGVAGLNDVVNQPVFHGSCGTCHDSPNLGDHSLPAPLNIGVADASRRTPDLPLITLINNQTGEEIQTSDPGRALITGKWADIGKFKGPVLRGLAARAPYFHNGSAATLMDVVNFYDMRFDLHLSQQEKNDLVAFLKTL